MSTPDHLEALVAEQSEYYRERAPEYDDWWYRRGRYDHGTEANRRWFAEAALVEAAVERAAPLGDVVELACGTGLWTRHLVGHATHVTAIDGSAEMLALNAARVPDPRVDRVEADLFAWEPERTYDACCFGFWLSHVPQTRFADFWRRVRGALSPGGRVLFVDSRRSETASATDHRLNEPGDEVMLRRLADGREFQIVKHWFDPDELTARLDAAGWDATVHGTREFFVYGCARPR